MPLKGVDFFKREVPLAERLHAFHDVEQPAPGLRRLVPEKQRLLPLIEDDVLGANAAALHDVNFSGFGNAGWDCCWPPAARIWSCRRHRRPSRRTCPSGSLVRIPRCTIRKGNPRAGYCSEIATSSHCRSADNTPTCSPRLRSMSALSVCRWCRAIGILRSRVSSCMSRLAARRPVIGIATDRRDLLIRLYNCIT